MHFNLLLTSLIWYSKYPRFGQWWPFQAGFCVLFDIFSSYLEHVLTFCIKGCFSSSRTFSAPALKSAVSPRSPHCGERHFESKIWVLGCSLLLGCWSCRNLSDHTHLILYLSLYPYLLKTRVTLIPPIPIQYQSVYSSFSPFPYLEPLRQWETSR